MIPTLDRPDMQGMLMFGYNRQLAATYLMLHIDHPVASRAWLGSLLPRVTNCRGDKTRQTSLNLAFTHAGLVAIAGPDAFVGFSREFVEGMVTPHRQRILGDLPGTPSDPIRWDWGGPDNAPVHVLVMLFATDFDTLEPLVREVVEGAEGSGLTVLRRLRTHPLAKQREHFGFRDGMTNPALHTGAPEQRDPIRAGEVVLGYPNEAGELAPAPARRGSAAEPWGHNGSYLVFRQIEQDVRAFWVGVADRSSAVAGLGAVELASKMVGRWPNGVPLSTSPSHPGPTEPPADTLDNFRFARDGDQDGLKCPMGSHIRRSNPRDALGDDPEQSLEQVRARRILRRGRSYGPPYRGDEVPDEARTGSHFPSEPSPEEEGRGLYFLGLNANLSSQFEFVQQTWLNSHKFNGATDSIDPIAGVPSTPGGASSFCIPGRPVHVRVPGWQPPIRVRGGAYFFLPGLRAMRQLFDPLTTDT